MTGVHSAASGSIPTEQSDRATLIAETEERVRTLSVCADLYDEIHTFMEGVTSRTYANFDASKDTDDDTSALQLKHITAMSIRADYRRTSKENRDDVALYQRLLKDLSPTPQEVRSLVEKLREELKIAVSPQWHPLLACRVESILSRLSVLATDASTGTCGTEACKAVVNQKADR